MISYYYVFIVISSCNIGEEMRRMDNKKEIQEIVLESLLLFIRILV